MSPVRRLGPAFLLMPQMIMVSPAVAEAGRTLVAAIPTAPMIAPAPTLRKPRRLLGSLPFRWPGSPPSSLATRAVSLCTCSSSSWVRSIGRFLLFRLPQTRPTASSRTARYEAGLAVSRRARRSEPTALMDVPGDVDDEVAGAGRADEHGHVSARAEADDECVRDGPCARDEVERRGVGARVVGDALRHDGEEADVVVVHGREVAHDSDRVERNGRSPSRPRARDHVVVEGRPRLRGPGTSVDQAERLEEAAGPVGPVEPQRVDAAPARRRGPQGVEPEDPVGVTYLLVDVAVEGGSTPERGALLADAA